MQSFYPGQTANKLQANVVAIADGTAIVAGTVDFYLRARTGDYEGYWWDGANEEWSDTEVSAGEATYVGGAVWELEIDHEDCWMPNVSYTLYWAESGSLHKPDSDLVFPMGAAYDGTVETTAAPGIVDLCNYAIAIVGRVAQNNVLWLDTFDGSPADADALPAMEDCQKLYPFARDHVQIKLRSPGCLRYAAPGGALAAASANTVPGWLYCFSRPTGCLLFLGVVNSTYINEDTGKDVDSYPYLEIGDQIACNVDDDVYFKYLLRLDDVTKFSEGLKEATAHRLAYLLARPLGVDATSRTALFNEYKAVLAEAMADRGRLAYIPPRIRTVENAHYRTRTAAHAWVDSTGLAHWC